MKFLVIDDHELIRDAMRGALQQLDFEAEILEAADGAQATLPSGGAFFFCSASVASDRHASAITFRVSA